MEFILPLVGGIGLYFVIQYVVKTPGRLLKANFEKLGNVVGKTKAEIESVVGPAKTVSGQPEGKVLLQWLASGFHIALLMKDDVCEGITHQHSQVG